LRWLAFGAPVALVVCLAPGNGLGDLLSLGGLPSTYGAPWNVVLIVASAAILLATHRLAPRWSAADRTAITVGYLVGTAGYLAIGLAAQPDPGSGAWRDAWTYFGLGVGDPYANTYQHGGSGYPPPLLQLASVVGGLGWWSFLALWSAAALLALLLIAGPFAAPLLLLSIVALEVWMANVNLLVALAIMWSFRWPVLWSLVVLTKITPGVGILWFAVRREWRPMAIAVGATSVIVATSLAVDPAAWSRWLEAGRASAEASALSLVVLAVRLLGAVAIVIVGARTDRPWMVAFACVLAMPFLWQAALAALVALVPLSRSPRPAGERRRAVDWALGDPSGRAIRGPARSPARSRAA
jgi:hypothetical protein